MTSPHAEKIYLALVHGRPPARGKIDLALARDARDRRRVVTNAAGARSLTWFARVARTTGARPPLALLRCRIATGRMHQIRVHLAASGWPIVGDRKYGRAGWEDVDNPALASTLGAFPRQALHAARLTITHPVTGRRLTIDAPLPPDMASLLSAVGIHNPAL
jgi:23S rRNA pseudouridine1911/1915/1917 synthase